MFDGTLQLISSVIGTAFPCAAVGVGVGHNVFVRQFYGYRQINPSVAAITEDTLFDLASLSKLVATSMIALKFIENGKLRLNDSISNFLDYTGNYYDCEIRHLMTHTSGMPAGIPLFSMQHKDGDALRTILDADRCYKTGEDVIYSCMGYIVLQYILENIGNESLDELARKYVFDPLGMKNACYNPVIINTNGEATPIAATERYPHTGEWATGHVHDENAYFLGGVSGNAGVFATLDDMISFAGMCSAKGATKNGDAYLSGNTFDLAVKNYTPDKAESRGLGFQLKGTQDFPGGQLLSTGSYGHTGFTGTSLYIDSDSGLWGILLTNAVHYGRHNRSNYFSLRSSFYDMMITEYKILREEGKI
ncbi:MAG: beta-lactamase family protein [Clostridia bacterium]|nr:beta-lactamase family protein [Clostridia bacterium]